MVEEDEHEERRGEGMRRVGRRKYAIIVIKLDGLLFLFWKTKCRNKFKIKCAKLEENICYKTIIPNQVCIFRWQKNSLHMQGYRNYTFQLRVGKFTEDVL